MEDRFKFRVWETINFTKFEGTGIAKRMSYSETELFDDMIGFRFDLFYDLDLEFENIKLMQCTGLKDKNGKLIYEGDILKCQMNDGSFENYKVIWDNSCSRFDAINSDDTNFIIPGAWHKEEIVGNIYENPKLMVQANED